MKYIFIILLLCILYLFWIRNKIHTDFNDRYIHNNDDYPEMKYIFENREIIQKEFFENILQSSNWSNWMEYDKVSNTPIFTEMTRNEILTRMIENKCKIGKGKPSWKLFGLLLYKKNIEENVKQCPITIKILNNCKSIINAGFSCLEPNVITALHKDFNHKILRCHIPIYIPKGNTAIKINNEIKKWNDNEYFIFDDTFDHQAWNFTNQNRIVLIIDILKK